MPCSPTGSQHPYLVFPRPGEHLPNWVCSGLLCTQLVKRVTDQLDSSPFTVSRPMRSWLSSLLHTHPVPSWLWGSWFRFQSTAVAKTVLLQASVPMDMHCQSIHGPHQMWDLLPPSSEGVFWPLSPDSMEDGRLCMFLWTNYISQAGESKINSRLI